MTATNQLYTYAKNRIESASFAPASDSIRAVLVKSSQDFILLDTNLANIPLSERISDIACTNASFIALSGTSKEVFDISDLIFPVTTSGDQIGAVILYDEDDGNSLLMYIGANNLFPVESASGPVYVSFSNSQDKVFSYTEAVPNSIYTIPTTTATLGRSYEFTDAVVQPKRQSNGLLSKAERALGGDDKRYKDISNLARPHPMTGDITRVFDKDAINKSLENILFTDPYEIPFEEKFGIGLNSYLFENIDPLLIVELRKAIIEKVSIREPRISIQDVIVDTIEQGLNISINYIINFNGDIGNLTLNVERN